MDIGDLGDNGVHAVLLVELDTELTGVNVSSQVHQMVVKCAKEQIWHKMNVAKGHVQVRSINQLINPSINHSFIHSFIHSNIHSFIHSFYHSFIH